MSRSYKKVPYCGDHKGKDKKRTANKAVRAWLKQNPTVSLRGSDYKRLYERYDICDYFWITTWQEYWEGTILSCLRFNKPFPNEKDVYRKWYKFYKIK